MQPSNASAPHLSAERLAAFDEVPFTADELAHLTGCAPCRAERDAMAELVAMAAAVGASSPMPPAPRLVEFDDIVRGLRSTPAVEDRPVVVAPAPDRRRAAGAGASFSPMLRRAAAALLLVAGGAVFGRITGPAAEMAGAGTPSSSGVMRTPATPVSLGGRPFADASFASIDEATAALNQAQRDYERASLWLASNDSTVRDPEVFRARLAALDQMMEASRVALRDAPQDPVLNHYYLAAYSAREATLQALGGALPVDKTIERY